MWFLLHLITRPRYAGDDNPEADRRRYAIDAIRIGLLGQWVAGVGAWSVPGPWVGAFWVCMVLIVLSTILLVHACRQNAWVKGHRPMLGAVLGMLSLPGVVILMLLKDRGSRTDRQRGFDVLLPKKVSGTWVSEESLTDPRLQPRPWGNDEDRAKLWRKNE